MVGVCIPRPKSGRGMRYTLIMDNIHKEIEHYWRELFASQLESLIYDNPTDSSLESKWFDQGMQHAIMMLRHTTSDDFPPIS